MRHVETLGNEMYAVLLDRCRTAAETLVTNCKRIRPTYDISWTGPVTITTIHRTFFIKRTVSTIQDVRLVGWKILPEMKMTLGVFEDGSIFAEGVWTRRKFFSGAVKSREDGIFRFVIEHLDLGELFSLDTVLHVALDHAQ